MLDRCEVKGLGLRERGGFAMALYMDDLVTQLEQYADDDVEFRSVFLILE